MKYNEIKSDSSVPHGMACLIRNGRPIYFGPATLIASNDFSVSGTDCHVHPQHYHQIARRAEATGKGTPIQ